MTGAYPHRTADHFDRPELDTHPVCHLTTTGRVTGRRQIIEIWFAHHQGIVYLLSGGGRWDRALPIAVDLEGDATS